MKIRHLQRVVEVAMLAVAIAAPFFVTGFTLFQYGQALCFGIGILGLKLLTGYNGQFSLGHSIFYLVGAYTTAILVGVGINFYVTLFAAAAVGFLFGFAVGWPALRIRGHHLAVVTLVLALAMPQVARSSLLAPLTGGPNGLGVSRPQMPGWGISTDLWWYFFFLVVTVFLVISAEFLVKSRLGRSMQASRDHLISARAVGINTAVTNSLSFGISAALAGLAGGLLMGPLGYVGPDSFTLTLGFSLFMAVLLTGPKWIAGSVLGGLILVFLPNWAESLSMDVSLSQGLTWAIYGLVLLAIIYVQIIDWPSISRLLQRRGRFVAGGRQSTNGGAASGSSSGD